MESKAPISLPTAEPQLPLQGPGRKRLFQQPAIITTSCALGTSLQFQHQRLISERLVLVAQPVKNLPAMWEIWILSLGQERSPREGKVYPLQHSGLENSMD